MNKRLLISLSLCLFIYGCGSSKKVLEEIDFEHAKLVKSSRYAHMFNKHMNELIFLNKSYLSSQYANNCSVSHDVIQARLSDVPVLFDVQLVSSSNKNDVYYLEYKTDLLYQEVMNFYKDEMENYGWVEQISYSADEVLMVFKKPGRSCVVSLRPVKKNWQCSKKIKIILIVSH